MRVLLALALLTASPSPSHTINRDRAVGPVRVGSGTLAQAQAAYGAPTTIGRRPNVCIARWRRLRLSMQFLSFTGNACGVGVLVSATAASRGWRTDRGLRVGATRSRLLALYPRAKAMPDGRWLITRRACREVGGQPFPGLKARMGRAGGQRRVAAFVVSASVCD
jgi:hypothetical protein